MQDIKTLCAQVRQTAYDIHVYHGHGHLEKVYENALAHPLHKAGLRVEQPHPIKVFDVRAVQSGSKPWRWSTCRPDGVHRGIHGEIAPDERATAEAGKEELTAESAKIAKRD
jgi:hypothetical protein